MSPPAASRPVPDPDLTSDAADVPTVAHLLPSMLADHADPATYPTIEHPDDILAPLCHDQRKYDSIAYHVLFIP